LPNTGTGKPPSIIEETDENDDHHERKKTKVDDAIGSIPLRRHLRPSAQHYDFVIIMIVNAHVIFLAIRFYCDSTSPPVCLIDVLCYAAVGMISNVHNFMRAPAQILVGSTPPSSKSFLGS
jgi:hypothetical protein